MSNTIKTVYPDGRVEERELTPEEIAQQEADKIAHEEFAKLQKKVFDQREADLVSAKKKLKKLGFTDGEISALRSELIEF